MTNCVPKSGEFLTNASVSANSLHSRKEKLAGHSSYPEDASNSGVDFCAWGNNGLRGKRPNARSGLFLLLCKKGRRTDFGDYAVGCVSVSVTRVTNPS